MLRAADGKFRFAVVEVLETTSSETGWAGSDESMDNISHPVDSTARGDSTAKDDLRAQEPVAEAGRTNSTLNSDRSRTGAKWDRKAGCMFDASIVHLRLS